MDCHFVAVALVAIVAVVAVSSLAGCPLPQNLILENVLQCWIDNEESFGTTGYYTDAIAQMMHLAEDDEENNSWTEDSLFSRAEEYFDREMNTWGTTKNAEEIYQLMADYGLDESNVVGTYYFSDMPAEAYVSYVLVQGKYYPVFIGGLYR